VKFTVHLAPRAQDVERWSRGEAPSTLVKSNNGRDVWRVGAGSPALYVKRFPPELLRDRARKEARLLQALHAAGIPCPKLVAVADDQKGSYILTEEIPDTKTLADVLKKPGRSPLIDAFGRLALKLHDAGFDHQDFHAGNVLVRDNALYVIDVHRAERSRSLSRNKRLDAVAFAAMSFVETRPLSDVLRFLRAYGLTGRKEQLDVWARLRKRHHDYYVGRQKRAFKEGSGFGIQGTLHYRKGIDRELILNSIKRGRRETVRRTRSESLQRLDGSLFVKTTPPARAKRIWENAHALSVRGIDTPRLWCWDRFWVAGEWVDSLDLHDYVRGPYAGFSRAQRLDFLRRLARVVRRLHDTGTYHADLKAGNILVGQGRILVIDLDRVEFTEIVADTDRVFNLAQLNAAVTPPLTRTERLRFLDYYLGNCVTLRKQRDRWIRGIMHATVARKHRWPLQSSPGKVR